METEQQTPKRKSRRRKQQVEPEVMALQNVYSALKPLNPDQRVKVIESVAIMLGGANG